MKNYSLGFTLAEILIVLVVIGIITAILLPVANSSAPDEKVMKFKKANATLGKVISELVNSDEYYADGDLGKMPNGDDVSSPTYLCETMGELLSTKKINCSTYKTPCNYCFEMRLDVGFLMPADDLGNIDQKYTGQILTPEINKFEADKACKNFTNAGEEIVTTDGIVYYQTSPGHHFGWGMEGMEGGAYENVRYYGGKDKNGEYYHHDSNGFDRIYKVLCIDIDGIGIGEDPFGYGIRADGKILSGERADEWMNKAIQKGN